MKKEGISRRGFLQASAATAATSGVLARCWGEDIPEVTSPRATDGDSLHEPDWEQRLTVTVGPKQADLVGQDDKVIQAAIDYVTRLGGGTVHLLPGKYVLRSTIFLPSHLRLLGSGEETVLTKIASQSVALAENSDWYDQEITLDGADAAGFQVGDSIVLRASNRRNGPIVIKRRLIARSGNRFKLSDGLRENLWQAGKPTCASLFPLLASENMSDVVVEKLTLDGNRPNNENFDGNYGGCVYLQDCNRFVIRDVEARNYNGDGISFQVCHDVVVENCHTHGHSGFGLHPGSGSQRPKIRNNVVEQNKIGLFWCWGVKYGLAEENRFDANKVAISIGHSDTDNLMRGNRITNSGEVAVLFRDERGFWPNRNRLEKNEIINSGGQAGIAIDIRGKTEETTLIGNRLQETRDAAKRVGIRIAKEAGTVHLQKNQIEGFGTAIFDQRNT